MLLSPHQEIEVKDEKIYTDQMFCLPTAIKVMSFDCSNASHLALLKKPTQKYFHTTEISSLSCLIHVNELISDSSFWLTTC